MDETVLGMGDEDGTVGVCKIVEPSFSTSRAVPRNRWNLYAVTVSTEFCCHIDRTATAAVRATNRRMTPRPYLDVMSMSEGETRSEV